MSAIHHVCALPIIAINGAVDSGRTPQCPNKFSGTYIVEFEPGRKILEEVLSSEENIQRSVASLVSIAKTCQFEGWLVNIECQLAPENVPKLQ